MNPIGPLIALEKIREEFEMSLGNQELLSQSVLKGGHYRG
jgi:hypothetical protein